MASPPSSSRSQSIPGSYSHTRSQEVPAHPLIESTLQTLEQRPPPTMQEILAAFTAKGDGDRDMLFALLNAKAAEDNRIAAERNLHRSLLELYKGSSAASTPLHMPESRSYPLPSPPISSYRESPLLITRSPPHSHRRTSMSSSSSHSSEDATHAESRKRRRSRSPGRDHPYRRQGSLSAVTHSEAPLPPSPYSSSSSSQSGMGSPRSRDAMTIGSLLSTSHERELRAAHRPGSHSVSHTRREDDTGRRHT